MKDDFIRAFVTRLEETTERRSGTSVLPDRPAALGLSAIGAMAAHSLEALPDFGTEPIPMYETFHSGSPVLRSGWTVDPSENLIRNGDFSAFSVYSSHSGTELGSPEGAKIVYDFWESQPLPEDTAGGPAILQTQPLVFLSDLPEYYQNGSVKPGLEFIYQNIEVISQPQTLDAQGQYLLQFTTSKIPESNGFADGFFAMRIEHYDPIWLRIPANEDAVYQFSFVAKQPETEISFFTVGYADSRTYGWPEGAEFQTPFLRLTDVSLVPIPEPAWAGLLLGLSVILTSLLRRCSREKAR